MELCYLYLSLQTVNKMTQIKSNQIKCFRAEDRKLRYRSHETLCDPWLLSVTVASLSKLQTVCR